MTPQQQRIQALEAENAVLREAIEAAESLSNEVEIDMWEKAKHEQPLPAKCVLKANEELRPILDRIMQGNSGDKALCVLRAAVEWEEARRLHFGGGYTTETGERFDRALDSLYDAVKAYKEETTP